jgi:hypothetical protein
MLDRQLSVCQHSRVMTPQVDAEPLDEAIVGHRCCVLTPPVRRPRLPAASQGRDQTPSRRAPSTPGAAFGPPFSFVLACATPLSHRPPLSSAKCLETARSPFPTFAPRHSPSFAPHAPGAGATPLQERRGRLIFGLDATGSRRPTWDVAASLTAGMFREAGGLDLQLIYYRGDRECRVSGWVSNADRLVKMMAKRKRRPGPAFSQSSWPAS